MGSESKGDVRAEQEAYRTGHMRRALFVAAVVLASSVALAPRGEAADAAEPLLGRWESVTRSAGGLGQVIELRADGSMTQWIAALVELTYQLQGAQLITTFRTPSGVSEVQSMTVRFEGNVMVQHEARSGDEITLTRKRAGARRTRSSWACGRC